MGIADHVFCAENSLLPEIVITHIAKSYLWHWTMNGQKEELLPLYTRSQLALRNGQDREEVWIAYKGLIYDVAKSKLWRSGRHYEHWAGQDLTDELRDAPHNDRVFEKFKVVGKLQK